MNMLHISALILLLTTVASSALRSAAFTILPCHRHHDILHYSLRLQKAGNDDNNYNDNMPASSIPRRGALRKLILSGFVLLPFSAATARPKACNAACLPGDSSPDCIGVYKVPVDDRIGNYVDTPEKLQAYAPDVRWVPQIEYPKTYREAVSSLQKSRDRCANLVELVRTGKLEAAGIELLDIVPKVTVAGRVVVGELSGSPRKTNDWRTTTASSEESNNAETAAGTEGNKGKSRSRGSGSSDLTMRGYRAEVTLSELIVALGQCDVLLGQGMRGQLGAPAPAQIQVLENVKEINDLFDELMKIIPERIGG